MILGTTASNDYKDKYVECKVRYKTKYITVRIPLDTLNEEDEMIDNKDKLATTLYAHKIAETAAAYRLSFPSADGQLEWIPKSTIVSIYEEYTEEGEDKLYIVTIHDWLLAKRGLI
jgi:hypothetical protein